MKQLLVLLLLACHAGYAQLPNISFQYISDRDGLPSRSVECAAEDTSGFMWFGTRKCLTRYDGYTFEKIGDRWVHGLAMDEKTGTVYYSSSSQKLIAVEPHSRKEKDIVGAAVRGAFSTFRDSFGNIWFSDQNNINRYDPIARKVHTYPMRKTTYLYHKGYFTEDHQRNVWVLGMEVGVFQFDRKANQLNCKIGLDCPVKNENFEFEFHKGFVDKQDQLWVPVAGLGLMRYDIRTGQKKLYACPKFPLLAIREGKDELGKRIFWVGSHYGLGIFRPDTGQFFFFENLIPQKYIVYDIVQSSRNGIVWVCTSEGILKYDPSNQFIRTNRVGKVPQPVNAMLKDRSDPTGQTYWMAVAFQGLYKWNQLTNQTTFFEYPQYSDQLESVWLAQDKNDRLWVGGNQWQTWQDSKSDLSDNNFEGIFQFDPVKGKYLATPFNVHHSFFLTPFYSLGLIDHQGRFWIVKHDEGMHVFDPGTNKELDLWSKEAQVPLFAHSNWVTDIFEDSRSRIWLTTFQGIFRYDESTRKFLKTNTEYGMRSITEGPDGNLWAVGWPGLTKLNKDGKIIGTWSTRDGLYDNECVRVLVDARNQVWIGTFDGLHLFDQKSNTFKRFTVNDGLLSNNTKVSLYPAGTDKLLVGNMGGWNTVDMALLARSRVPSEVHLVNARINNQQSEVDWTKPVVLADNENAISFSFSMLNFRKSNDNHYAYYLEGFETDWRDSGQDHQAFYTNLAPGDYTFHAKSVTNPGRELRIPFTIKPAWYETWWFRTAMGLVVLSLLGYIYRSQLSYRTIKAKLELEELTQLQKTTKYNEEMAAYQLKLSETEMASLRSQMNPHFIFNCLNSIQFFAAQNDSEKASNYLSKFSRLIRLVLENSKSEHVTLENELETLRLYIEMEAMRFPGKLVYQIEIDQNIDPEMIQIPPLLLQPFVENAIWHGLMHKDAGGAVRIVLKQIEPDMLHVEITDNGVGRQKAADYKSKSATKNKSLGMKITADRIELINQLYKIHTNVGVIDLVDQHGAAAGTKVVLNIPI
ncbi:MAG: histidine kinase [Dyadobacter sp.]|uniref:sensor histidine kinase n=1 Tax=Dyadobacter sp. TaxID=1914288 RepID=UPI00326671D3